MKKVFRNEIFEGILEDIHDRMPEESIEKILLGITESIATKNVCFLLSY